LCPKCRTCQRQQPLVDLAQPVGRQVDGLFVWVLWFLEEAEDAVSGDDDDDSGAASE
jgi:hypothetical protein